jgi:hypothetical protein
MAAYAINDGTYPPQYSKRFTSFASQLILHLDTANGGAAPVVTGMGNEVISYLPCQVVVEVAAAAVSPNLDYIDGGGALVSMAFPAGVAGLYVLRMAPSTIETTTGEVAVTVFWSQKG